MLKDAIKLVAVAVSCVLPFTSAANGAEHKAGLRDTNTISSQVPRNIRRIFTVEMIGAEIPYLESIVGPAMKVENGEIPHDLYAEDNPGSPSDIHTRIYKVSGCSVAVIAQGTRVVSMGITISQRCQFDLNLFFPGSNFPRLSELTFGKFDQIVRDGVFTADCLGMCGNGFLEYVYENWVSPHVYDFRQVSLLGNINLDDNVGMAAEKWRKEIVKGSGEDYVINGTFNCDKQYDRAAHAAFRNVRVGEIWVGGSVISSAAQSGQVESCH
jgi:hypothetical protein